MKTKKDPHFVAKNCAGRAAAALVQEGMLVGLGTGSTAAYFIDHLIDRVQKGLKIEAVVTSEASLKQALQGGIPIIDINEITSIDLAIDGVDQIDPQKRMIKGAGGALLREKIVANMSREMVVILDPSKWVQELGGHIVPVEVVPFAHKVTQFHLAQKGYKGELRMNENSPYLTDNSNYIIQVKLPKSCDLLRANEEMKSLPGVVETGLFLGMAGRIIIGFDNDTFEVRE